MFGQWLSPQSAKRGVKGKDSAGSLLNSLKNMISGTPRVQSDQERDSEESPDEDLGSSLPSSDSVSAAATETSPFKAKRKGAPVTNEPSFLSSSPRMSPAKRQRKAKETEKEKESDAKRRSASPQGNSEEFLERRVTRSASKEKGLFSPGFSLFGKTNATNSAKKGTDSDPVTPENQKETPSKDPPPTSKVRRSLKSVLENEGAEDKQKQISPSNQKNVVEEILEIMAIEYSDEDDADGNIINQKSTLQMKKLTEKVSNREDSTNLQTFSGLGIGERRTSKHAQNEKSPNNPTLGEVVSPQKSTTPNKSRTTPNRTSPNNIAYATEIQMQDENLQVQVEIDDRIIAKEESYGEFVSASPVEQTEEDFEEDPNEFDPYYFIRTLPPLSVSLTSRNCDLPAKSPHSPPITLVLDLDETLVHCTTNPIEEPDLVFPVDFNGERFQVYVSKRPHLEDFLARVSQMFEVVVFTASQQIYADALLDLIDKEKKWIRHRLFRESCLYIEGNYLKELSVLGRDLAKTIIVDNSPQAFGFQLSNGIPIVSWYKIQMIMN